MKRAKAKSGPLGRAWKEYAEMAIDIPSRVQVQSYTFVSPMGDSLRYLLSPAKMPLLNFGVMALAGVIGAAGTMRYQYSRMMQEA